MTGIQKALVVVDMQNDFVTGVLGTPEARAIVPKVAGKVRAYHDAGLPVVFTKDTHWSETYPTSLEGVHLPVLHCVVGSDGWQLVPELESLRTPDDVVVEKPVFGSKRLVDVLGRLDGVADIEMVGVCTGICVISNAVLVKTFIPGMEVHIDGSACACVTPESHRAALKVLGCLQCVVTE